MDELDAVHAAHERLGVSRRMARFPAVLTGGYALGDYLGHWRRDVAATLVVAGVLAAVAVGSGAMVHVAWRRQQAYAALLSHIARTDELTSPLVEFDAAVGTWWWRVAARDERGRQSRWAVRRVFIEKERPADLLRAPDDGASFGFLDGPPRIAFQWAPKGDARTWRLVISRQRDLLANPVVSELVNEPSARVDSLQPGDYFWGVFAQGAELEPVFIAPRRLVVKKVKGAVVAPKRIRKWGP